MNAVTPAAERLHTACSPSSAYRFTPCPGSVRLIAQAPPQKDNVYAQEGTAAHALIALCYADGRDALEYIDREIEGFVVGEDMAEAAQVMLDFMRAEIQEGDIVFVEHRFTMARLGPPVPYDGTTDFSRYRPSTRHLLAADYKHGAGVPVAVIGNLQLRSYALGACVELEAGGHVVADIDSAVVQPRAPHRDGPIRREHISAFELTEWASDLFAALAATQQPDAPLSAGDHCKFCPAAIICPEMAKRSMALVEAEFSGMTITLPPAPESLAPERIAQILNGADIIETWLKAVREHAAAQLAAGAPVPGWKLVDKRAIRKWVDDEMAAVALAQGGVDAAAIFTQKIITPAKAEGLVGKKNFGEFGYLITAESSGTALAPEADKRPAVTGGREFTAIPQTA